MILVYMVGGFNHLEKYELVNGKGYPIYFGTYKMLETTNQMDQIYTWWLIPVSKWVITPVINGISRVNLFLTGVITHLLSGMSHQVSMPPDVSGSRLAPAPLRVGRDVPRRRGAEAGHEGPAPGGTDGGRAVDGLGKTTWPRNGESLALFFGAFGRLSKCLKMWF